MKEVPMLFSTPMVQAILDGRKSQTRRIIKPQPELYEHEGEKRFRYNDKKHFVQAALKDISTEFSGIPHKYKVGDILWVRETSCWDWRNYPERTDKYYFYRASCTDDALASGERWTPSIHMPKSAARIWLEIKEIGVERLKCISKEDAIAEGVRFSDFGKDKWGQQERGWHVLDVSGPEQCLGSAQTAYGNLWIKINGEESYNSNPFVWVIKFTVLSTTGKPILTPENK